MCHVFLICWLCYAVTATYLVVDCCFLLHPLATNLWRRSSGGVLLCSSLINPISLYSSHRRSLRLLALCDGDISLGNGYFIPPLPILFSAYPLVVGHGCVTAAGLIQSSMVLRHFSGSRLSASVFIFQRRIFSGLSLHPITGSGSMASVVVIS